MRACALLLALCSCVASAQVPLGDYPSVGFSLISVNDVATSPAPRVFAASEITCALAASTPPSSALQSSTFVSWADPLNVGLFCQADITNDVRQIPAGQWYASLTFFEPPVTWTPCPEYDTNGGCWAKTLDGRLYPTYNIQGHETPAFSVGTFPRVPTNLVLKAE